MASRDERLQKTLGAFWGVWLAGSITEKSKKPVILEITGFFGAGNVTRTHDLLITNQLLYRLSYASSFCRFLGSLCILSRRAAVVNRNCRYFAPGLRLFRFFSGKLSRWYGRSRAPPLQGIKAVKLPFFRIVVDVLPYVPKIIFISYYMIVK